jgi:hypothetical protein
MKDEFWPLPAQDIQARLQFSCRYAADRRGPGCPYFHCGYPGGSHMTPGSRSLTRRRVQVPPFPAARNMMRGIWFLNVPFGGYRATRGSEEFTWPIAPRRPTRKDRSNGTICLAEGSAHLHRRKWPATPGSGGPSSSFWNCRVRVLRHTPNFEDTRLFLEAFPPDQSVRYRTFMSSDTGRKNGFSRDRKWTGTRSDGQAIGRSDSPQTSDRSQLKFEIASILPKTLENTEAGLSKALARSQSERRGGPSSHVILRISSFLVRMRMVIPFSDAWNWPLEAPSSCVNEVANLPLRSLFAPFLPRYGTDSPRVRSANRP